MTSNHLTDLFRTAFERSPSALVLVDELGRILLVNVMAETLFGYSRSELIGEPVETLVPGHMRDAHRGHRQAYVEAPDERPMGMGRELHGLRKDGSEFPVEVGLNPIATSAGNFVLSAILDITERKLGEERVRAAAEELARSNADLAQFAYVASHDLQEPLRMVTSYVQILGERFEPHLDDETREFLQYAVDGSKRMKLLIRDLLEYSRVGTGGLEAEELDLDEAVRLALENLQVAIEESGAEVDVDDLPRIEADPIQMVRLFQNLVGNAIKFRGEEPPRIRISARPFGSSWEIEVADNGIGLEPRFAERVFGVFQRLHSGEHPGTGIGLAICKKIVERHGGSIAIESEPGQGTSVLVALPRRIVRWY